MKKTILSILLLSLLACQNNGDLGRVDDYVHLRQDEAIMPVNVRGNAATGVMVIVLHGGPGGSAIHAFANTEIFKPLEEDFVFAYWDQRGAGLSQGNNDNQALSFEKYRSDLTSLVKMLKAEYAPEHLFVMGHSWGTTLAIDFLKEDGNEDIFDGAIFVNGSHNMPLTNKKEKFDLIAFAERMIDLNIKKDDWVQTKRSLEALDYTQAQDIFEINRICYDVRERLVEMDSVANQGDRKKSTIRNLSTTLPLRANAVGTNKSAFIRRKLLAYDASPLLNQVSLPALVLAGKYDFVVPQSVCEDLYAKLGSPTKEYVLFESSHHSPMFEETQKFNTVIQTFIFNQL